MIKKAKYKMRVSNRYNKCSGLSRDCSSDKNNYLSVYQPGIHGRNSKDGISSLCKRFKNNRDILNGATFNIKCHGSESIFVVPNTLVTLKLTKQEDGQDNYLIKSTKGIFKLATEKKEGHNG